MSLRATRSTQLSKSLSFTSFRRKRNAHTATDQRKFFDELGNRLGVRKLDDWYTLLSPRTIKEVGIRKHLKNVSTASVALKDAYPEHVWMPWKFETVPHNFWKSIENQRAYFDWLGKELGVKELDDWYQVLNHKVLKQYHGASLLSAYYNSSAFAALKACYPNHNWLPWKFDRINSGFWKSLDNQREFFDWLGKQLGVKTMDDWYSLLSTDIIIEHGGHSMIHTYYKGSAIDALKAVYPEHNWIPWKFNTCPKNFWQSIENQRAYFDWLGKELGVEQLDDWYSALSTATVLKNCGGFIRHRYNSSVIDALKAAYPEYDWIPWKFRALSHAAASPQAASSFVAYFSDKLSISTLDDWYRVDNEQLFHLGATQNFIRKNGGLYNILKTQYPDHPWDPKKFRGGKKAQRWLIVSLQKLYPNHTVIEDYIYPNAFFASSKRPIQLDAYIPSLSLAFEYQGQQHFQDVPVFQPHRVHKERDNEKRALCEANNVKLVEVPYWWNKTLEGLQEFIDKATKTV